MAWLSVAFMPFPCPSAAPFLSGVTNFCTLHKEPKWPRWEGEGSGPEGPQDPYYCSLASDNQLSFDRNNLMEKANSENSHSLSSAVHMKSSVLPPLLNDDIHIRH